MFSSDFQESANNVSIFQNNLQEVQFFFKKFAKIDCFVVELLNMSQQNVRNISIFLTKSKNL